MIFDAILIIIVSPQVPYVLSFSLFMILAGLTLPRSSSTPKVLVPRLLN